MMIRGGRFEVRGELRYCRFIRLRAENDAPTDWVDTKLTIVSSEFGRQELAFTAAFIGASGLGERVEMVRGEEVSLEADFEDDGSFWPLVLRNQSRNRWWIAKTSFEPLPIGRVEFRGIIRKFWVHGTYGTDVKTVEELVIASPEYGTWSFRFSAYFGNIIATRDIQIFRGDDVTYVFENRGGSELTPIEIYDHTRGYGYRLNSGWTLAFGLLDALGNIGRAFRRR